MSGWRTFKGITVVEVFRNVSNMSNHYRIELAKRSESGIGNDYFTIDIQQSDLKDSLNRLLNGATTREYFAFGMTNIDVYKKGDSFVIDQSPFDGCHDEYVLKKGELERLIQLLTFSTQRETQLQEMLEKMVKNLNNARNRGEVIFASDWNEELQKLGVKEQLNEDSRISVSEMIK